jgi:putative membrane protein
VGFLLRLLVNAAAVYAAVQWVPGIRAEGLAAVLTAALVLALVNTVIRPVLLVVTLPITLITLGVFLLVLNAFCFWLTAALVPGFAVDGFLPAFLGAIIVSAVSWLFTAFLSDAGRVQRLM